MAASIINYHLSIVSIVQMLTLFSNSGLCDKCNWPQAWISYSRNMPHFVFIAHFIAHFHLVLMITILIIKIRKIMTKTMIGFFMMDLNS